MPTLIDVCRIAVRGIIDVMKELRAILQETHTKI